MKNQHDVNKMVATVLNVDLEKYTTLLERGFKPAKALIRLGADRDKAGLVGGLKLATTAKEIDEVYADTSILSCMTGKSVGQFYAANGINVLYGPDFRCLVGSENGISVRAYGTKHHAIYSIIREYFPENYAGPGKRFALQRMEVHKCTEEYTEEVNKVIISPEGKYIPALFTDLANLEVGDDVYEYGEYLGTVALATEKIQKWITVMEDVYMPILSFPIAVFVPFIDFEYQSSVAEVYDNSEFYDEFYDELFKMNLDAL